MLRKIKKFLSQKGQGVMEYALILGFVAILAVGLFSAGGLKEKVSGNLDAVGNELEAMDDAIFFNLSTIDGIGRAKGGGAGIIDEGEDF